MHLSEAELPAGQTRPKRYGVGSRSRPRLDYLALATDKNKAEYMLHVRELVMSVMYEKIEK